MISNMRGTRKIFITARTVLFAFILCFAALCGLTPLRASQAAPSSKKSAAKTRTAQKPADAAPAALAGNAAPSDWREAVAGNSDAPVTIVEFFDYQCPFCLRANPALDEAIKKHPGKIHLVLKNLPLAIHPDSLLAHEAALAAAEQGHFWEMHDLLFANPKKVKLPDLIGYARQLHLDVPRFQQRLESGFFKPAIDQDKALASALGITGTPSYFINGQTLSGALSAERFGQAIDDALEGKKPAPAKTSKAAKAASVARGSVRDLDLSRAPARGDAQAPVTVIEFSDLQCPFCARVTPTLREIMAKYPGQVRWVFKSFPLGFHKDSPLAHAAVMAAARQGKFWEMHDLIFSNQKNLKRDNLMEEARSLNLDMIRFIADLDNPEIRQQIEADRQEGEKLSVTGTPSFFINGRPYSGALSIEQFQAAINTALALPQKPEPAVSGTVQPIAPVTPHDAEISVGAPGSPLTLVWFSDLQSGLTLKTTLLVRHVIDAHPGKVRLVFKNRPLETHPGAMLLHEAAMAANAQGKFWQMHDLIVANPQKATLQDLMGYARRIGLDTERFQKDLDAHAYRPQIEADIIEAQRRSVLGSPVFFLNSTRIDGLQDEKIFNDLIDGQLAAKR